MKETTQNSDKTVLHDERGKFVKGHPKIGGNQLGDKHPISVIGTIENMFERDPAMFLKFVDDYLGDPRNRQHIVEMIDGKPRGSETNVAIQINNYDNSPETLISEAKELLEANGYVIRKE